MSNDSEDWARVGLLIGGQNNIVYMAESQYRALLDWLSVGKEHSISLVVRVRSASSEEKQVLTLTQGSVQMVGRPLG